MSETPKSSTKFSSDTASAAGVKSGIARRPVDHEGDSKRAYQETTKLKDIIAERLFMGPSCKSCKREGPIALRDLVDLSKLFISLSEAIQNRGWGKPPTASAQGRSASIDDFKRAQQAVKRASLDLGLEPSDLPPPPELEEPLPDEADVRLDEDGLQSSTHETCQ